MQINRTKLVWAMFPVFLFGALLVAAGPADAGRWHLDRTQYHNTSQRACVTGVRISRWQLGRRWYKGRCWVYIAGSQAEYNRHANRGARRNNQAYRNRICKTRHGRDAYYSTATRRCARAGDALLSQVRRNRMARIAHRSCGAGNYVVTATRWRCIRSTRGGRLVRPQVVRPDARTGVGSRRNSTPIFGLDGRAPDLGGSTAAVNSCQRRCGGPWTRSGRKGCSALRGNVCPRGFPNGPYRGCCFDR